MAHFPRTSIFREAAIRAGTAVAVMASISLASMTDVSAQQVSANEGSPACASITDAAKTTQGTAAAIKCEFNQSVARTKAANERGAAADARAASSQSVIDCVQFLTTGVKSGTFAKNEILQKADGKLNDSNACPVARQFGFGRKADAAPTAARLN